jgi:hypothetical protein
LPDGLLGEIRVQCHRQKFFASAFGRNSFIDSAVPSSPEGRFAIVTNARRDAMDVAASSDE